MLNRDQIIAAARRLAREGNFTAAIRRYEKLVEEDPSDLGALLKIGYLHACNRDREAAAEAYLEAAHAYEQAGDKQTAAKVLTQVLRLQPEQVDVYFWLAELLGGLGQLAEGRRWLEAAERLLIAKKRPKDALRVLEAMLRLDPGNVALLIRLGEARIHAGKKEEALEALRQAADILRMAEWMDDFVKVAERIAYLDQSDLSIAKELSALYLRRKDPQAALRKLQRCYRSNKDDPATLGLLVEAFVALGEKRKAVTILEALVELHRQRGEAEAEEAAAKRILGLDPARSSKRKKAQQGARIERSTGELLPQARDSEEIPRPLNTDEHQLATLERSLQPDPRSSSASRRFLPALTAQTEERIGRKTSGTTELDLADLEEVSGWEREPIWQEEVTAQEVAKSRADESPPVAIGKKLSAGPVLTQELDIGDVEIEGDDSEGIEQGSDEAELDALGALIDEETERRRPFRPVTTLPDASLPPTSGKGSSPQRRPRR
ncbi:MAG: tetratricopeptide repeat protein [Polyangia bacterium]|jgi:tetratricopeptide (TPR) repeat protein|nr:tetratricopeptide repeat protein [Polyangia bacterium]